jgi:hypothetical protein
MTPRRLSNLDIRERELLVESSHRIQFSVLPPRRPGMKPGTVRVRVNSSRVPVDTNGTVIRLAVKEIC